MHIISLHDPRGMTMVAAGDELYTRRTRIPDPSTWILFNNISRPGKWPTTDDTIELRELRTNRLLTLDVTFQNNRFGVADALRRTDLQTDHTAERFTAMITVRATSARADGMLTWHLSPYKQLGTIEVTVHDHTVGARLRHAGQDVHLGSTNGLHTGPERGRVITFHAVPPDDLVDVRSGQEVWLSIDGMPIVIGRDRELVALAESPTEVAAWEADRFRIETIRHRGIVGPGAPLRLRPVDDARFPERDHAVVVREGRLVTAVPTGETDVFEYASLVDLAGYWHAARQDNAIFADAPPRDYTPVRSEGQVFVRPRVGTVPVKQFFSPSRGDTMTTATVAGQEAALAGDYTYRGVIGWAYERPQPSTRAARQYWHSGRGDNMLTATEVGEGSCHAYRFLYEDCYVLPPSVPARRVRDESPSIDPERAREVVPRPPGFGPPVIDPGVLGPRPGGGGQPGIIIDPAVANDLIRGGTRLPPGLGQRIRPRRIQRGPVRALVLSGGGAKGAFEAGAIQALWQDGYRPDIVCGVSVGAINAVKVAENTTEGVNQLVDLWRDFSADRHAVYLEELYVKLLERTLQEVGDTARDAGIMALIGKALLPGPLFMDDVAGITAGLVVAETSDLSDHMRRLLNLVAMSHSIHSMEPLRRAIARNISPAAIAAGGMRMRLGISDAKTGCYFSVTEPFADRDADADFDTLVQLGLVELEPDMAEGGNWLTQPIFDCDHYSMSIADAVYASCVMPIYMEPLEVRLSRTTLSDISGLGRVGRLSTGLPAELRALIDAAAPGGVPPATRTAIEERYAAVMTAIDRYATDHGLPADANDRSRELRRRARAVADGNRGATSESRLLFDGGLVDAIPIRTAIRMGATEILVIGVDQLHAGGTKHTSSSPIAQFSWIENLLGSAGMTGGIEPMALTMAQHLVSTIGGMILGTTRSDVLSSLGVADARRIGHAASERLTEAQRVQLAAALREHSTAPARKRLLGGTTALGGWTDDAYGNLSSSNLSIDVILPDRPLLDSLAFADRPGVDEAIELGRIASRNPVAV